MRIAQRTIYNNMLNGMQSTLGAYMESNIQSSSQKKVNRPSDDPAGTARIMNYRASLEMNRQQRYNADTAKGWLTQADGTLQQVSTVITSLRELAEQVSSSTYDPANRLQVSNKARELFGQLINLANAKFEDQRIFGGHKYDVPAYQEGLAVTTGDDALKGVQWKVEGNIERSTLVRFPESFTIDDEDGSGAAGKAFEWSDDGGATWNTGVIESKDVTNGTKITTVNILKAGGAQITIPQPETGEITLTAYAQNVATNPEGFNGFHNGSQLIIRPGAFYMGDDNDKRHDTDQLDLIDSYGAFPAENCTSSGNFTSDVRIRIDGDPSDPSRASYYPGQTIYYSYSSDNGATWTPARTEMTSPDLRLPVDGGFMDLAVNGPGYIDAGQHFVIRPHRANLGYEIMPGEYLDVNNVGKDIFGGLYQTYGMKTSNPPVAAQPVFGVDDPNNLFEVASRLVAFTECNNQDGVQQCLEDLGVAHKFIMSAEAKIGGKADRLAITQQILGSQKLDKEERLSYVEDVDLTELLTRLSQQELAYSTVLKSSSMIMQLNLTKFI